KPLVYLDNAATVQKPLSVIEAVEQYYTQYNSNIHRGTHTLSRQATEMFEQSREKIRQFIGAKHAHEIIFTKGTTESVNLVASSFAKAFLKPDDEIIISAMEHHANIVPWQLAGEQYGSRLKIIPLDENGDLQLEAYENLFSERTKLVAVSHVSNVLGTINPIKKIIDIAHQYHVPVLVDGAQGIKSRKIDVQDLDCDFYCFSGHKIYAPMGIGILYGKEKYLDNMPPYQGGGEMIDRVSFEKTTFNRLPFKFEAGTPNVGGAVGLAKAIDFMTDCGIENMIAHEDALLAYATRKLQETEGVNIIGTAKEKAAVISFLQNNIHPTDTGTLLDMMGVAVRTGHHCAQPLIDALNIPGTVRISFAVYNDFEDIDIFIQALQKAKLMLE
ncbi:MAG: cysteine desulfurase, partial [Bacteroidales bacterium]|nr:cysteine desulfurase [Bacteroidales bacterium]